MFPIATDPRLNPADAKQRRELAGESLFMFANIYLSHLVTAPFGEMQRRICGYLDAAMRTPVGMVVGATSREHGKTTLGTTALAVREICLYDPKTIHNKDNIVIIGATQDESDEKLANVKHELESNELLLYDFGSKIKPMLRSNQRTLKDTQQRLQCQNGVYITARPYRGKMRGINRFGSRLKLAILDDPEDDDSVESPRERDRGENWINKTLINAFDAHHHALVWLGTILHDDSVLMRAIRSKSKAAITFIEPAADEWPPTKDADGNWITKPAWPEYWSIERLLAREEELRSGGGSSKAFMQEFMCKPGDPDAQMYKPDWWRYYDPSRIIWRGDSVWIADPNSQQPKELLDVFISVDPAVGLERKNDFTGIIIAGTCGYNREIYILDIQNLKLTPSDLVNKIIALQQRWSPRRTAIEHKAFQAMLVQRVCDEGMTATGVIPLTKKDARVDLASKPFQQGRVYLPIGHDGSKQFTAQAESYPNGKHDDMVDAWAQLLEIMTYSGGDDTRTAGRKRKMYSIVENYRGRER